MTLRHKTFTSITITTALLIGAVLLLANRIVLGSFDRLEEQNIQQNARQTARMLDDEAAKLSSTLLDWAYWDDTYQFVADSNHDYIANNLNVSSLVNLGVNFMVFTNVAGQVVNATAVDLESARGAALPPGLLDHIRTSAILSRIDDESVVSGIILIPDFPVLIASAPILNSLEEGPAHGRMIAGCYFDASKISQMAEKLQLSVSLHRLGGEHLSAKLKAIAGRFDGEQSTVITISEPDTIEIFFLIRDIYQQPVLFMGIDKARAIYAQGRTTLAYLTLFLLGAGWLFMFVTAWLMEKVVLSRLRKTSRQVKAIETNSDFETRITLEGRDELAYLAVDINKMLDALQHSTERDRNILENIVDGYCETDLRGRIQLTNPAMRKMTGYTEKELLQMGLEDILNPEDMAKIRSYIKTCIANNEPIRRLEGKLRTKTGQIGNFDAAVNPIGDNLGRPAGFRSIIRDVTAIKQNEERLAYLAYHDPLTGLYNRKAFMDRLEKEIAYARRYNQERVLLFMDLDKFKDVNDTYGHDSGDALLAMVAKRMCKELRDTDVIARMGGDEFTILLTNPENVPDGVVCQRMAEIVAQPFEINGQAIDFVSASIGSKRFPTDADTAGDLIKAADREMYRVKAQRKHAQICKWIGQGQPEKTA